MTADRGFRTAVVLIATIAILAAIHFASSVFAPLAFALFIIAIVWPLQNRLQSRLPKLIALAIVMVVVVVVLVAFASLIAWGFGRVAQGLLSDAARFQLLYERVTAWLEGHGIAVAALWAEHFNIRWLVRAVQDVTGRLNTTLTFWLIVLVYVILGLLEVDDAGRRVRAMEDPEVSRVLLDGSVTTAVMLRKYMLVRTLMSAVTGVLVGAFAALAGLQFAAEWGVIAFALNYIPFIGPFIATLFPTLFALAQFESWQAALVLFAGLNVIQFVVGSYIEPRICGITLAVSPMVVLFAVFFWTFLWGLFGAFIGVPITIALLTFCAQHASSRWLPNLLGAPVGADKR
ncbi:MAG TPA: AI-2E family transporter [Xanthobacteraceae bacterium]|nr:AI-2E family transporter [Xanthobacteraceae bacterium]